MPGLGGDAVEISGTERSILEVLKDARHSPADAAKFLKISRPAVSYHLNNLKKKGLVRQRRGVKGAGSYVLTTAGLRHIAKRLEDFDEGHQGCLVISPNSNNREVHHWDAMFQLDTPFLKRYPWSRTSKPPNEHHFWKDDFNEVIDGEEIHVPTIRYIHGKKTKSITLFLEFHVVDDETSYLDVEEKNLDIALKVGAWFSRNYGCQLSLIKWSGAPHYVLGMDPEVALVLKEAGIKTDFVQADVSPRIGQPHLESPSLEYAMMDATTPHHIKNLYAKGNQTQVMVYKVLGRTTDAEQIITHHDHIINSLMDYIQALASSVDKLTDYQVQRGLDTETIAAEVLAKLQETNDKKKAPTDPGDMFR